MKKNPVTFKLNDPMIRHKPEMIHFKDNQSGHPSFLNSNFGLDSDKPLKAQSVLTSKKLKNSDLYNMVLDSTSYRGADQPMTRHRCPVVLGPTSGWKPCEPGGRGGPGGP